MARRAGGRAARRLGAGFAVFAISTVALAAGAGYGHAATGRASAASSSAAAQAEPASAIRGAADAGSAAAAVIPTAQRRARSVIVIGVPGLRWSDISAASTPALWQLLERGAAAAMSLRTAYPRTCPVDGWLTLGAGSRATASHEGGCVPVPVPEAQPAGGATIPGFAGLVATNDDFSYEPQIGLMASAARQAAGCVTAVGPGAAVAVADETGRPDRYLPDPAAATTAALATCPITLIDAGTVPDEEPAKSSFLEQADGLVDRIVSAAPDGSTLVVAGIADRSATPHLGALIVAGPGFTGGWLTADSTRHDGLVQLTDLTPTVLSLAGVPVPDGLVGAVITATDGRPAGSTAAWHRLAQQDVAAQTIRDYAGIFFVLLEVGQIALYAVVAYVLYRRRGRADDRRPTRRAGGVLLVGALFVASAPVASFLANLVPWWRAVHPAPVLALAILVAAAVLTGLALLGPWRRWHPLGAAGFIATVTTAVLAADVVVGGSRLQLSSLYGLSALIAGRFYGFGNVAFAVFAMSAMFTALTLAALVQERSNPRGRPARTPWRPRVALAAVAAVAVLAVLADGWPSWGADFGGVAAMVPGFALLGLAVAGIRPAPRQIAGLAAAAIVAVTAIAMLDWLRPKGQRSHLGRFVQQVLDGQAGPVLDRKLDAMARSFTRGPEGVVIPILLLLVAYLLVHPERFATLEHAFERIPLLRPGLVAMLTTALVGVVANDSGIQVAAVCLTVTTPLVVATCAGFLSRAPARTREPADVSPG